MRRPLFGNGFPKNITLAGGSVTVLDTEDIDENVAIALTLYLWWFQSPGAGPFTPPRFVVSEISSGGPAVLIGAYSTAFFNAIWKEPVEGFVPAPLKILDKHMLRGQQKVVVDNTNGASEVALIWGYYELAGEQDVGVPFRGLQPGALVTPYNYEPVSVQPPLDGAEVKSVHRLSTDYIDLVTLDVATLIAEGDAVSSVGVFVGNSGIPQPGSLGSQVRYRMFDGIPMRASSSDDAGSLISLAAAAGGAAFPLATAYGSFVRT